MKSKIAVFDYTRCEGRELQNANPEEQIVSVVQTVDVVSFPKSLKEQGDVNDIAFVECHAQRPGTAGSRSLGDIRAKNRIALDDTEGATPKYER